MLKIRYEIWMIVLFVLLGTKFGINYYNESKIENEKQINAEIITANLDEFDIYTKNSLSDIYFKTNDKYYKINPVSKNADFIITETKQELKNYDEIKDYLFSPYVLVGCGYVEYLNDITEIDDRLYSINLKTILEAIENKKDWSLIDNNLKEDRSTNIDFEDPVSMTIVENGDLNKIKNFFALVLNDYIEPNENEKEILINRVNTIINNCKITNNENLNYSNGIYFINENIFYKNKNLFKDGIFDNLMTILVPEKTFKKDYILYAKDEKIDIIKKIIETPTFIDTFGIKNINYNQLKDTKYYSYTPISYNFIDIENTNEVNTDKTATASNVIDEVKYDKENNNENNDNKDKTQKISVKVLVIILILICAIGIMLFLFA